MQDIDTQFQNIVPVRSQASYITWLLKDLKISKKKLDVQMYKLSINYSFQEMFQSPGWRPTFKNFNVWTAAAGGVLCVAIMFMTNVPMAVVAIIIGNLHFD